jgi:hypothetical protein
MVIYTQITIVCQRFMMSTSTVHTKWLAAADKDAVITGLLFTATPVNPADTNSVCHWRISLVITRNKAIQLDMNPVNFLTGCLIVKSISYLRSIKTITEFLVPLTLPISGQTLLDQIIGKGRDRYTFHESGGGCRYWCKIILSDVEAEGLVAAGSSEQLEAHIVALHSTQSSRFPYPEIQGTFHYGCE